MLVVDSISKTYNQPVFSNYSKNFEPGILYVITGPNASGKSTLLHGLSGAVKLDHGQITLDGLSQRRDAVNYRKKISMHFSDTNLFSTLTAWQFWNFHFKIFEQNQPYHRLHKASSQFKLLDSDNFLDKPLYTLSSGTKRKVLLIATLLRDANVYLLDEPDSNLDEHAQLILIQYLKDFIEQGKIVILVSHSMAFLDHLVHEIENVEHIPWQLGMTSVERVQ